MDRRPVGFARDDYDVSGWDDIGLSLRFEKDIAAFERFARDEELRLGGLPPEEPDQTLVAARAQQVRALRHALSEFDVEVHAVRPAHSLGEALAS